MLIPIMILIFILVWIFIGFPIFTQIRPGLNNKLFTIYKFKTLYDGDGDELSRLSSFGNFLRKFGLDELPQLINILKNDMSLIGPRPLLKEYLNKYSKKELKRHNAKPGITGLAQIISKNSNDLWSERLNLDIYYVENISFILDVKIFINTIKLVFLKKKYSNFKKLYE